MIVQQVYALTCIFWKAKGKSVPVEVEWSKVRAKKRCTKSCPYWTMNGGLVHCTMLGGPPKVIELLGKYR